MVPIAYSYDAYTGVLRDNFLGQGEKTLPFFGGFRNYVYLCKQAKLSRTSAIEWNKNNVKLKTIEL